MYMPKYRVTGFDKRRQSRKEIVDAHNRDIALSIAYTRGISKTAGVEIEELNIDGSTHSTTQIDGSPYEDAIVIPSESRFQRAPISTIAIGVFIGLFPIVIIASLTGCLRINIWFW